MLQRVISYIELIVVAEWLIYDPARTQDPRECYVNAPKLYRSFKSHRCKT